MRVTGIALVVIAAAILTFAGVMSMTNDDKAAALPHVPFAASLAFPIATAVLMGCAGVLLYLYGDRGYQVIRHPRVQPIESRVVTNSSQTIEGTGPRAVPQPSV